MRLWLIPPSSLIEAGLMFSKFKTVICALTLGIASFAPLTAQAVSVTASSSYIGDICDDFDADGGPSGIDFNDCKDAVQNGGPVGLFGLEVLGLRSHIVSDAVFTISASVADLFLVGGGNNPIEHFGFSLDNIFLGTLFDESTVDEAIINAGLAASVEDNIAASTGSDSSIELNFSMSAAEIAPIVQDQRITAWFDFQGAGVNSMRNLTLSVSYEAVPLPASGLFLVFGLAGLGLARRRA